MKSNIPFKNLSLDANEKGIERALESENWVSNLTPKRQKELRTAATTTIESSKSKKITIRVNQGDLVKLKAKALKKNIPYQTLLGVIVRDFVDGKYSIKL